MISAHDGPLAAMAFDLGGTRIATASNKVCRKKMIYDGYIEIFNREQSFEFIVLLMDHVYLNYVVELYGRFANDSLLITITISELQQSTRWHSVLIQCF